MEFKVTGINKDLSSTLCNVDCGRKPETTSRSKAQSLSSKRLQWSIQYLQNPNARQSRKVNQIISSAAKKGTSYLGLGGKIWTSSEG